MVTYVRWSHVYRNLWWKHKLPPLPPWLWEETGLGKEGEAKTLSQGEPGQRSELQLGFLHPMYALCWVDQGFFLFLNIYLFICLFWILGVACGILADQGWNLGPLHWQRGVLVSGPTREVPRLSFAGCLCAALSLWPLGDCPLPYKTDWYSYPQPTPCGESFISLVKLKLPSEFGISVW